MLINRIANCMVTLELRLKEKIAEFESNLEKLGKAEEKEFHEKSSIMVDILNDFSNAYKRQIDGPGRHLSSNRLNGAARIQFICRSTLISDLASLDPLTDISDNKIIIEVKNSGNPETRLYSPELAFRNLTIQQIGKMKTVAIHTVNLVHQEMKTMVETCLDASLQLRFPKVNKEIVHSVFELLSKRMQVAKLVLENFIDVQSSSAITAQGDFYTEMNTLFKSIDVKSLGDMPNGLILKQGAEDSLLKTSNKDVSVSISGDVDSVELSQPQKEACEAIKKLIQSYFEIARIQVQDYVPKSLLHSLVYFSVDHVQKELVKQLHLAARVNELIEESEAIAAERISMANKLKNATNALEILDKFRGHSAVI